MTKGSEYGPRTIDVGNWSGRGLYSPRNFLGEFINRDEFQKPGVYILQSESDSELYDEKVYIGEAEVLATRLKQHIQSVDKNFSEVITFISKDELLTKSHIKYLESRLVSLAKSAGNAEIENSNSPSIPFISEADQSDMEYFIEQIKIILPVTGFRFLLPRTVESKENIRILEKGNRHIYSIKSKKLKANMYKTEEGYVILAGSQIIKKTSNSLGKYWTKLRSKLIENKILIEKGEHMEFTKDTVFNSPSAASSIVLGYQTAGPIYWLDENDKTLGENEILE